MKRTSSAKTILFLLLISSTFISIPVLSENIIITLDYYGPLWDINHDGVTNYLDASLLVLHYGESGPAGWIREDINEDGTVNYLDASIFIAHYGETWVITP